MDNQPPPISPFVSKTRNSLPHVSVDVTPEGNLGHFANSGRRICSGRLLEGQDHVFPWIEVIAPDPFFGLRAFDLLTIAFCF